MILIHFLKERKWFIFIIVKQQSEEEEEDVKKQNKLKLKSKLTRSWTSLK